MIRPSPPLGSESRGVSTLTARPMGIDTYQEPVVYMRADRAGRIGAIDNRRLAKVAKLAGALDTEQGVISVRQFPDGETYVRGETPCEGRDAVLAANLFQPNAQILPLIYCVRAARVLGARRVLLVSPYLPYMRQDARFQPGEVVTSRIFSRLLSDTVDGLVTIGHLTAAGYAAPVCIGAHAVFAGDALDGLERAGAARVVTCNSIEHPTNAIDLTSSLADGVRNLLTTNADLVGAQELSK